MKRMAVAVALGLSLASCQSIGGKSASLLSQITTSLPAAIASAQVLVSQAQSDPLLSQVPAVQKQAKRLSSYLAAGTVELGQVNTLAATLLGLAGAAGVTLPGL